MYRVDLSGGKLSTGLEMTVWCWMPEPLDTDPTRQHVMVAGYLTRLLRM